VSLYDLAPPNGTIIKYDFSGNEISRIYVPRNSDFIHGLTWDGSYLWAHQESPNCLLRIDPDTSIISKNITLDFTPHGLVYYRNRIWADAYSIQRVVAINPNTGEKTDYFDSVYFLDSGIACNETHFMQSNYLDSMEPFAIAFFELPQEPGDVFTKSSQLFTNVLDITYKKDFVYFAENSTTYIYGISDSQGGGFITWSTNSFNPVGMTIINDNYLLMSSLDAPYNLYTFTMDGTLVMNQTSEVNVMMRSLEFDGTYVWAMGIDGILYKLDPIDMSIIDQFTLSNRIFSIAYDYDLDVLWAVDKSDHTIKYINTTTGEYGENTFDIQSPISTLEYGLAYDGEFLIIATSYSGGYLYKILKGELDPPEEPPTTTPPPSTTPTSPGPDGLFPSLPYYIEDLIFFGIGAVLVGLIFGIIAIVRRSKGA
jgi:hypothetical protein